VKTNLSNGLTVVLITEKGENRDEKESGIGKTLGILGV